MLITAKNGEHKDNFGAHCITNGCCTEVWSFKRKLSWTDLQQADFIGKSQRIRAEHHENNKTTQEKILSPISLYSNHFVKFQLALSGDIEINHRPEQHLSCSFCEKSVRKNSRYDCQVCRDSTHTKCLDSKTLIIRTVFKVNQWTCSHCLSVELPFHNIRDILYDENNNRMNLDDTVPFEQHTVTKSN